MKVKILSMFVVISMITCCLEGVAWGAKKTTGKPKDQDRVIVEISCSQNLDSAKSTAYDVVSDTEKKVNCDLSYRRISTVVEDTDDNGNVIYVCVQVDNTKTSTKNLKDKFLQDKRVKNVQTSQRTPLSFDKDYSLTSLVKLQWGLDNTGQTILGSDGKENIDIGAFDAWEICKGSDTVKIGLLDTGIDIDTKTIRDNIDTKNGWDFVDDDNTLYDKSNSLSASENNFHGTAIASVIAAKQYKDGKTTMGMLGVAPNVTILPLKVIENSTANIDDMVEAIEYGYEKGVRIFNCSFTISEYSKALRNVMAHYRDCVFVCAAGNESKDIKEKPVYPACFNLKNVISVGAITNQGKVADFSNYGDVDVYAPGRDILCAAPNDGYSLSSGTSIAAAFVSGTIALMRSHVITDGKTHYLNPACIIGWVKDRSTRFSGVDGKVSKMLKTSRCLKDLDYKDLRGDTSSSSQKTALFTDFINIKTKS